MASSGGFGLGKGMRTGGLAVVALFAASFGSGQTDECIPPTQRAEVESQMAGVDGLAGPAMGPQPYAVFPQAGMLWQDLFLNNFVDLDPTSGILDWDCSQYTYDGHQGYDSNIRSFREQAIGVPVFAALDGTVAAAHDGEFDMQTNFTGAAANYVVLSHGNTQYTWYYHLKNGSISVTSGQVVCAGTQVGLTGSSGNSTAPHLHFESRYNNTWYEPSTGACHSGASYWTVQLPIRRDLFVQDFCFSSNSFAGVNILFDPAPRVGVYLLGSSRNVYFRVQLGALPASTTWRVRFKRPNGTIPYDLPGAFGNPFYRQSYWSWSYTVNLDALGPWHLLLDFNGQTYVDAPFDVVSTQAQIVNRPPNPISVAFDPSVASSHDVIFCRVQTSLITEDPDYDIVQYLYRWTVNGTVVRGVTNAALSDALRAGLAKSGDIVACVVTPSDGVTSGPPSSIAMVIDPNADADGDGLSNEQEFIAGTNPTNATSTLRITAINQTGNNLRVTWVTGPGKTNALQAAGSVAGSYATIFVATNTIGTITNYLDVGAATNTMPHYYRVRLVP